MFARLPSRDAWSAFFSLFYQTAYFCYNRVIFPWLNRNHELIGLWFTELCLKKKVFLDDKIMISRWIYLRKSYDFNLKNIYQEKKARFFLNIFLVIKSTLWWKKIQIKERTDTSILHRHNFFIRTLSGQFPVDRQYSVFDGGLNLFKKFRRPIFRRVFSSVLLPSFLPLTVAPASYVRV